MKNIKLMIFILSVFLLSCAAVEDDDNGTDVVYDLSGKLQKGPCFKDGKVVIQPLNAIDMNQTGEHYTGFTKDDLGTYDIPAEISETYAEVYFEGECHNEITGGTGSQRLSGIIKVTDLVNNINPLTKIRSQVARDLFDNEFGDIESSLIEAERLILLYLDMPVLDKRFTEMNLEEGGTHDAVLALTNSMILYGRTEAEQGDYTVQIANGVIGDDLALKDEIAQTISELPLITIKNNLESRYTELGLEISVPPIWTLGSPDYYADLLGRTPLVLSEFNLADTTTCNFELSTFNTFAIPHVFDAGITDSNYIAMNLVGDVSIWTKETHAGGYFAPGVKIMDIETLKESLLTDPVILPYNGKLGDNKPVPGTEYYIVIRKDVNFVLNTSCEGGLLPFGRKLASDDEMATWIGWNNSTAWFRKSGVRMFATD